MLPSNALSNDDFPLPIWPTIATNCFRFTRNDIFLSEGSCPLIHENDAFLTTIGSLKLGSCDMSFSLCSSPFRYSLILLSEILN